MLPNSPNEIEHQTGEARVMPMPPTRLFPSDRESDVLRLRVDELTRINKLLFDAVGDVRAFEVDLASSRERLRNAVAKVEELEASLRLERAASDEIRSELDVARSAVESLEMARDAARREIDTLRLELQTKDGLVEHARQQTQRIQLALEHEMGRVAELEHQNREERAERESVESQRNAASDALSVQAVYVNTLRDGIVHLEAELEKIRASADALQQRYAQAQEELQIVTLAAEAREVRIAELERGIGTLRMERDSAREEAAFARKQFDELSMGFDKAQAQAVWAQSLARRQVARAERIHLELDLLRDRFEATETALNAQHIGTLNLQADIEEAIVGWDLSLAEVEAARLETTQWVEECESLLRLLEGEAATTQTFRAKATGLTSRVLSLEAEVARSAEAAAVANVENRELRRQLEVALTESQRLAGAIEERNSEVLRWLDELELLQRQFHAAEETLAEKERNVTYWRGRSEALDVHLAKARADVQQMEIEKTGLASKLQQQTDETRYWRGRSEALDVHLKSARASAEKEAKDLRGELDAERAAKQELSERFEKLAQAEISRTRDEATRLSVAIHNIQNGRAWRVKRLIRRLLRKG